MLQKALRFGGLFFIALAVLVATYLFVMNRNRVLSSPVSAWVLDHKADCAVVLTGGPNRLADGFEQLYLKRVKKLIISGVYQGTTLQDLFPQRFFFKGVRDSDITLEKKSLTTYGNAQQSLIIVQALNCRDVVLITSHLHMYRAYQTFRFYFPQEIPIYQRATIGKRLQPYWTRTSVEALKAVFYDLWMY